jgi:hypothetical protein
MIHVVVPIVAAGVVALPAPAVIDMRRIGMPRLVAVVTAVLVLFMAALVRSRRLRPGLRGRPALLVMVLFRPALVHVGIAMIRLGPALRRRPGRTAVFILLVLLREGRRCNRKQRCQCEVNRFH